MLFIYWGWDTAVSVNEETKDRRSPGRAAVISTVILLSTYALVILSVQSFAGLGSKGIGLGNPAIIGDVLSVLGPSDLRFVGLGPVVHLLLLMVLSSAAASTQTTILPTARTTLSMAVYKAIPLHSRRSAPVPHADGVDGGHGRGLHHPLRRHELLSAGRLIADSVVGPRRDDRLLLRPDRIRLRLVLPQDPGAAPAICGCGGSCR